MSNSFLFTQILNLPEPEKHKLLVILNRMLKSGKNKRRKIHPKAGCMKGTFVMKDGFE
jgi:hypothetical protein